MNDPIQATDPMTAAKPYLDLAEEVAKVAAAVRSVCCAAELRLSAPLPQALTQMQQVLDQLDYLFACCQRHAIELLRDTACSPPQEPPLFLPVPELTNNEELAGFLDTPIRHLCAVFAAARPWFKYPNLLSRLAADLTRAEPDLLRCLSTHL